MRTPSHSPPLNLNLVYIECPGRLKCADHWTPGFSCIERHLCCCLPLSHIGCDQHACSFSNHWFPHVLLARLAEQRKHLIGSLNAFACGPNDGGDLDTAVNASEQLQQNMAEEVRAGFVWVMDSSCVRPTRLPQRLCRITAWLYRGRSGSGGILLSSLM